MLTAVQRTQSSGTPVLAAVQRTQSSGTEVLTAVQRTQSSGQQCSQLNSARAAMGHQFWQLYSARKAVGQKCSQLYSARKAVGQKCLQLNSAHALWQTEYHVLGAHSVLRGAAVWVAVQTATSACTLWIHMRKGGIAPDTLNNDTNWKRLVSITPWHLYLQGQSVSCPIKKGLAGLRASLDFGEQPNLLFLLGIEPQLSSLVTILSKPCSSSSSNNAQLQNAKKYERCTPSTNKLLNLRSLGNTYVAVWRVSRSANLFIM